MERFYATLFHSPFTRLTKKAFAWLSFVDYKNDSISDETDWQNLKEYKMKSLDEIFPLERSKDRTDNSRFTAKALKISAKSSKDKLDRYLDFGKRIGNMYVWISKGQLALFLFTVSFVPITKSISEIPGCSR